MAPVLTVKDLSVRFALHQSEVTAVSNLNFALEPGETLAVVGESGSGKSQAFLALMGLAAKNATVTGQALLGDVDLLALGRSDLNNYRGRDISMIFQDPMTSLNPTLRVREQLGEVLVRHQGYAQDKALKAVIEMLERVGIPEPARRANAYPHELSGGMRQRVMIALTNELGTALVLITHDLGVVAGVADKMMVMYGGRCVEQGGVDALFYDPRHPYTLGLLHSTPHVEKRAARLEPIEGLPPSLEHLPVGCAFHPRCAFRFDRCLAERPQLTPIEGDRAKACFYEGRLAYEEVA
jgi:oligopeptide transport system ATP-binding protein